MYGRISARLSLGERCRELRLCVAYESSGQGLPIRAIKDCGVAGVQHDHKFRKQKVRGDENGLAAI